MPNRLRHLYRSLAVIIGVLGLISYLPLPFGAGRVAALANSVVPSPALTLPALQGEPAVQQLKEQGLYDSLAETLAEARYKLQWEDQPALGGLPPSYHAANPSQRLAAYFTSTELHLASLAAAPEVGAESRASRPAAWRAAMRLIGYGYGENLLPVAAFAELTAQENRIEYRRPALPLTEWYANKAEGLEQGFNLAAPPGARVEGSRLRVALEMTGDLRAESIEEGEAIALRHVNRQIALRYGELHAYDANEQLLPSRLRVEGGRIILEVDDAKAAYPVTIDPLITQQQKLTASDGAAGDSFGESVAISGDTVVVGAPRDDSKQGSAYVFVRSGTTWSQQQKLTASDGAASDWFGISVGISGDTVVVGQVRLDDTDWGSAYIFVRSGATWSQQQKLTASQVYFFGYEVEISGETVVVGAHSDTIGANIVQGSVYVFVRSGTTWSQPQKLTASDGAADHHFGWEVAISADTLVVGAPGVNSDQGSAYVFVRRSMTWSEQQKLTASDGAAGDGFGLSVAISGDTVVVGASQDNFGDNSKQGSAYVFGRIDTAWTEQQKLSASDGAADDHFGNWVAISGDTIVAAGYNAAGVKQGSAYVFGRSGTSWSQQQHLTAPDGAADDRFGFGVAIAGDTAIVGAPRADIGANIDQGSAYVFATWGEQQKLAASDAAFGDHFGSAVAVSRNTVVVGAPLDDNLARIDQGSAYVFVRNRTTWILQQKLTGSGGAAGDEFGSSVAINEETIVVGADGDDIQGNNDQGSAYVFVRSGTIWSLQQKLIASEGAAGDRFGSSVALSGDTVVVGAPLNDVNAKNNPGSTHTNQGSAYVFVRRGTIWGLQQTLNDSGGATGDEFGSSVAISKETIVVGAPDDDVGVETDQGSANVFVRSGVSWSLQQQLTGSDSTAADHFAHSVAISGDTIVVGAPFENVRANINQGSAYVFARDGITWSETSKLTAAGGAALDHFGESVAISGDTAVVGASYDDVGASNDQGSAYVFVRNGSTWNSRKERQLTGSTAAASDHFGRSVAIDLNTVVVGAPFDDIGLNNGDQGSAYVFVRK